MAIEDEAANEGGEPVVELRPRPEGGVEVRGSGAVMTAPLDGGGVEVGLEREAQADLRGVPVPRGLTNIEIPNEQCGAAPNAEAAQLDIDATEEAATAWHTLDPQLTYMVFEPDKWTTMAAQLLAA